MKNKLTKKERLRLRRLAMKWFQMHRDKFIKECLRRLLLDGEVFIDRKTGEFYDPSAVGKTAETRMKKL